MPIWVRTLKDELRVAATALLKHPLLNDLKESHAKRGVSMFPSENVVENDGPSDPLASIMALY